ncbi:DUF2177 family protein [bacterium]|nr:DUF2177 family protein [bacterium]NBX98410.1 DUF2177 family protein [bacterium]NDC93686.1 DUF2177 family protein [bacterium]NDD84654.1 DUF2177 family protein [bacterium]NDG28622.1 DUF2177 family protein [bacterium]
MRIQVSNSHPYIYVIINVIKNNSQAVYKDWPIKVTVVDLLWGTVLTAGVCSLATWLFIKFFA